MSTPVPVLEVKFEVGFDEEEKEELPVVVVTSGLNSIPTFSNGTPSSLAIFPSLSSHVAWVSRKSKIDRGVSGEEGSAWNFQVNTLRFGAR